MEELSLESILGTFTKAKNQLTAFISQKEQRNDELSSELADNIVELKTAGKALKAMNKLVGK